MELRELTCALGAVARFHPFRATACIIVLISSHAAPSWAQQAAQPGFDPRQTERRFDTLDTEQQRNGSKSLPRLPGMSKPTDNSYDHKPAFALRGISVVGAS